MSDILNQIVAVKREEVANGLKKKSLAAMRADAESRVLTRDFVGALRAKIAAGQPVPASTLPTGVVEAVEARMSKLDPQGETILELRCAACGHQWRAALDIGRFFWQELAAEARRLLREVHLLASAYGWGEAEILALTPARRDAYLAQVMG